RYSLTMDGMMRALRATLHQLQEDADVAESSRRDMEDRAGAPPRRGQRQQREVTHRGSRSA
ncbi:MAG TPA: hypothetical protein VGN98_07735, partial [Tianweitania sediminis]|nr:hypothetical protein [Tianweitania sediminis]